jgi:LysR family nitrogen assimilation transcriptional regulator
MDLRQLRYFLSIAEARSFSRAAERVHIAQPALSAHVGRLEEELGVRLFHRTSKGVELTRAGIVLAEHAVTILKDVQTAQDAVRNAGEEVQGHVSLGLTTSVSMVVTVALLERVRSRWPRIELHLVEGHSGWLMEWLLDGRLDSAIIYEASTVTKTLRTTLLLEDELYLIGPPSRVEPAASSTVTMGELAEIPLMLPGRPHGLRAVIDQAAASAGLEVKVEAEVESVYSIKEVIVAGMGHTVTSLSPFRKELARNEVSARRIVEPQVLRNVVLATRADRSLSEAREKVEAELKGLVIELVHSGQWPGRLKLA